MPSVTNRDWHDGEQGALDTAILFVDLIDSSVFASILGLEEYASYVRSFVMICEKQIRFFFDEFLHSQYNQGSDYDYSTIGDELVVFLHTGNNANDVYLLTTLAISLKCAWLAAPLNQQRLECGNATSDIAAGINFGSVWALKVGKAFILTGYVINLAKRIESFSRTGQRFLIFLSDAAFKQVNLQMRNLVFGRRTLIEAKGIVWSVGVYELYDSFVNPVIRLQPELASAFKQQMVPAIRNNSRDLWIHSCLQVSEESSNGCVTDRYLRLCEQMLAIDNSNPVAIYYLAQGHRERGALDRARLLLENLTTFWPSFGDGWLEYGRLLLRFELREEATRAFAMARLHEVMDKEINEAALPPTH